MDSISEYRHFTVIKIELHESRPFSEIMNTVHCGLASAHKSSVHHALYGVLCTEATEACTLLLGSQKRSMESLTNRFILLSVVYDCLWLNYSKLMRHNSF